jgi:uncharacterized protein YbaP (TraB family)
MLRPVLLSVLSLVLASPAVAQQPAAEVDLGSPVVEELEVVAKLPGPALWRARGEGAEVIILGGVTPLPHSLVWDTSRVEQALDGARQLLIPPRPKVGVFDGLGLLLGGTGRFKDKETLEAELGEPLRARFAAARTAARKEPSRYEKWKPQVAGFLLVNDFRDAAGLSSAKPASTLTKLAKAKGVPVRSVGDFRLVPLAKEAAKLDKAASVACLQDAVSQVEIEARDAQALAAAWAEGDLRGVRAHYGPPALERCVQQAASVNALIENRTEQGVQAILGALSQGGKTVAVVDLNYLLRPNGVLDRLKARGVAIDVPRG